jgi:putative addiction module killer protein
VIEVRQTEAFAGWFDSLHDRKARARIDARIRRLSLGNPGDVKPIGGGVSELRSIAVPAIAFILYSGGPR